MSSIPWISYIYFCFIFILRSPPAVRNMWWKSTQEPVRTKIKKKRGLKWLETRAGSERTGEVAIHRGSPAAWYDLYMHFAPGVGFMDICIFWKCSWRGSWTCVKIWEVSSLSDVSSLKNTRSNSRTVLTSTLESDMQRTNLQPRMNIISSTTGEGSGGYHDFFCVSSQFMYDVEEQKKIFNQG